MKSKVIGYGSTDREPRYCRIETLEDAYPALLAVMEIFDRYRFRPDVEPEVKGDLSELSELIAKGRDKLRKILSLS